MNRLYSFCVNLKCICVTLHFLIQKFITRRPVQLYQTIIIYPSKFSREFNLATSEFLNFKMSQNSNYKLYNNFNYFNKNAKISYR